jgi:hypothetical protein
LKKYRKSKLKAYFSEQLGQRIGDSLNLKTNRSSFRINYFSSWENNENWKHTQKNNFGAIPKKVNGRMDHYLLNTCFRQLLSTNQQHFSPPFCAPKESA